MRIRLLLLVASALALVVAIVAAAGGLTHGSAGSSAVTNLKPTPPAMQILSVLRSAHLHPTSCARHGSRVTCDLAEGGRCTVTVGGAGGCSGPGSRHIRLETVAETVTTTPLP